MDRSGKGRGRGGNFLRFSAFGVFFYDITFKRLRYFTCNILTCFSLSSLFYFTFITGRLQWSIIFYYIPQYLLIIVYNLFLSFSFLFSISSHSPLPPLSLSYHIQVSIKCSYLSLDHSSYSSTVSR